MRVVEGTLGLGASISEVSGVGNDTEVKYSLLGQEHRVEKGGGRRHVGQMHEVSPPGPPGSREHQAGCTLSLLQAAAVTAEV